MYTPKGYIGIVNTIAQESMQHAINEVKLFPGTHKILGISTIAQTYQQSHKPELHEGLARSN